MPHSQPKKKRTKALASRKRKGKEPRKSYWSMSKVEYAQIRQRDWYTRVERDDCIEDDRFWCTEQMFIHEDIYLNYKHPIRPQLPIRWQNLQDKDSFSEAARVMDQFGLVRLMETQCDYNVPMILQFFATLVIKKDIYYTMKWMTGSHK